jgi:hypothetical protein
MTMNDIAIRERALSAVNLALIEERKQNISERTKLIVSLADCAQEGVNIAATLARALNYVRDELRSRIGQQALDILSEGSSLWIADCESFSKYRAEITPALEYYGYTVADHPQRRDWAVIVPIEGEQA